MSTTTTWPSSASRAAIAAPTPRAPPVTTKDRVTSPLGGRRSPPPRAAGPVAPLIAAERNVRAHERATLLPRRVPCWVDVLVPDPSAVEEFYGDVFGWDFTDPEPRTATASPASAAATSSASARPPQAMPSWNTYIRVESVEAAA